MCEVSMEPDSTRPEKGKLPVGWKLGYEAWLQARLQRIGCDRVQEGVRAVISYDDDVYVWVYLDQVDRVLRYEAYVIDYDDNGRPSTLRLVIEEGVLDNVHEVELISNLLRRFLNDSSYAQTPLLHAYSFTAGGQLVAASPLLYFYNSLSADELAQIHAYFSVREEELKREKKVRWMRTLRALGFDVVYSL